jgi:glycosyltransferase involved in cell wall biosynthesis
MRRSPVLIRSHELFHKEVNFLTVTIDVRMMWSSGIGVYIRHLVSGVINRYPDVHFLLLGWPEDEKRWEGFQKPNVRWVPLNARIFTLWEQVILPFKISRETNLYWSPNYNIPLFYRGKILVTVHDVLHLAMGWRHGAHRRFYARTMFRALTRRADRIICVSNSTRNELTRLSSCEPSKMKVVHNGLDASWFEIPQGGRPYPRPYLLFVGNVKPHKNLVRLIRAFDQIKSRIPQDLVLVGKKEGFSIGDREVLHLAERMGDRVRFTGFVEEDQLRQYYAHADLLVFPSVYEGFGFPPLEAMACGCPTAVSGFASLREICADATSYFDPLNVEDMSRAMLEVLQNEGLKNRLVEKGRRQARLFSWEKCVRETCQVLDGFLS